MSAVVYARVPDALKQGLEAHAAERALSLTAAVVELVGRGLEASTDEQSIADLERKLAGATRALAETRSRLSHAELSLRAAREREELTMRIYTAFAERARHELARCPQCRQPVRGSDLFISGHCSNCEKALTSLLVPTRLAGLVQHEYLALLGALSVLVGLARTSAAEGVD
jgi:hypothetical protein